MITRFTLILFTLLSVGAYAQNNGGQMTHPGFGEDTHYHGTGALNVHQSAEIQMLSARFKVEHNGKNDLKGFRVQVYVGDRNKAGDMKTRVNELYPDTPVEINYLAPNFRVRVGNFRTNLDADRFLRQIKVDFPNAYVVPDEIGLPKLW